jgi:hypothetical protein
MAQPCCTVDDQHNRDAFHLTVQGFQVVHILRLPSADGVGQPAADRDNSSKSSYPSEMSRIQGWGFSLLCGKHCTG